MTIALGIDTGGTYTDAVLVDLETGKVMHSAKALTTYQDLAVGVSNAIGAVFGGPGAPRPGDVQLVGLSTTLATNALIEGRGAEVCLVLIGYDPGLIREFGFQEELVTRDIVYVSGGHDCDGNEAAPLDEESILRVVADRRHRPVSYAVSGYFGVMNPEHEIRARKIIQSHCESPVTCGHELTSSLDSIRRATTVALNAGLVPMLRELMTAVRSTLLAYGIGGRLMVVRGDGSLVTEDWAVQRPIETILSGPAASVVGAWHLAKAEPDFQDGSLWVMDMGGTTTDIACLQNGRPLLNGEGARVSRWRTMVEAVDAHTVGLGGDSLVTINERREPEIGPARVVPLCTAAKDHPEILRELERQAGTNPRKQSACQFLLFQRSPRMPLMEWEFELLKRIRSGPVSLEVLENEALARSTALRSPVRLESHRLVMRVGFTPTDALHHLGLLSLGDRTASSLGASVLSLLLGIEPDELCRKIVTMVSNKAARALVTKALMDEGLTPKWEEEKTAQNLIGKALSERPAGMVSCSISLTRPLVAMGAPVFAYVPAAAERLHAHFLIPPHSEVANAVGAVVGGVLIQRKISLTPLVGGSGVRAHLADGVRDFDHLEEAVEATREAVEPWLREEARRAGAADVQVDMERSDTLSPTDYGADTDSVYLGTELTFRATGRPSPARN